MIRFFVVYKVPLRRFPLRPSEPKALLKLAKTQNFRYGTYLRGHANLKISQKNRVKSKSFPKTVAF